VDSALRVKKKKKKKKKNSTEAKGLHPIPDKEGRKKRIKSIVENEKKPLTLLRNMSSPARAKGCRKERGEEGKRDQRGSKRASTNLPTPLKKKQSVNGKKEPAGPLEGGGGEKRGEGRFAELVKERCKMGRGPLYAPHN